MPKYVDLNTVSNWRSVRGRPGGHEHFMVINGYAFGYDTKGELDGCQRLTVVDFEFDCMECRFSMFIYPQDY